MREHLTLILNKSTDTLTYIADKRNKSTSKKPIPNRWELIYFSLHFVQGQLIRHKLP